MDQGPSRSRGDPMAGRVTLEMCSVWIAKAVRFVSTAFATETGSPSSLIAPRRCRSGRGLPPLAPEENAGQRVVRERLLRALHVEVDDGRNVERQELRD